MNSCRKPVEWNEPRRRKKKCPVVKGGTCLMKDREIRSQDTMPWSISSKKAVRVKANISPKLQERRQPLSPGWFTGENARCGKDWRSLPTHWVPLSTKRASVPMPSMLMNSAAKVGSADSLASSFRASSRASMPWDWIRSRSWRAARACRRKREIKITTEASWYANSVRTLRPFSVIQYLSLNLHLINEHTLKQKTKWVGLSSNAGGVQCTRWCTWRRGGISRIHYHTLSFSLLVSTMANHQLSTFFRLSCRATVSMSWRKLQDIKFVTGVQEYSI